MIGSVYLKEGARMPEYADEGSSGADLFALTDKDIVLLSGEFKTINTGVYVDIPQGNEIQIRPRSGLAAKNGITVLNTPGTIDSSYRGEIKIILINLSKRTFVVTNHMKIAQMVGASIEKLNLIKKDSLDELSKTERGEGGFGHTGV